VDSQGIQETGQPYKWVNKLTLRFNTYDAGDEKKIKLEASAPDARILYTTDGSDPKESGAVYAGDFVIPKDSRFVLAIAEKKGIYSDKLDIPINWSKSEGFKIDKLKKLTYQKRGMYKTNNNKSTYEELNLFKKHDAKLSEVFLNFTFKLQNKEYWSSLNFDPTLNLTSDQINEHIDFMRNSMPDNTDFETTIQIGGVLFPIGQAFEHWMSDKQIEFSSLNQAEIIQ